MSRLTIGLITLGVLSATAAGLGIRRWVLEHQYKKSIPVLQGKFNNCIQQAMSSDEISMCYLKLQREAKK